MTLRDLLSPFKGRTSPGFTLPTFGGHYLRLSYSVNWLLSEFPEIPGQLTRLVGLFADLGGQHG